MKKALITGVTGQDGSYLAEFLLEKDYEVHGIVRRASTEKKERIDHLEDNPNFHLHYGDLTDSLSLVKIISKVEPDEIYNLAAQSHVAVSFEVPEYTADATGTGVIRLLEAIRICGLEKNVDSIRRQLQNYLVRYRRYHRVRPHLFILIPLMLQQSSMPTG